MKHRVSISSLVFVGWWYAVLSINAQVNVTQEHNHLSRDGVYIDASFTPSAAANLTRDLGFNGTISGAVYAQPLYIEGGPNGPMVIAVTESNNVYALNAATGLPIWSRTDIGAPVPTTPCGGFNPTGITGTPVVDLASRRLFFDALINTSPIKHFIYSLDVDTGVTTPGWPVDVNATAVYNTIPFVSLAQEERGGLALVNGIVYVPYSGYGGDCGTYHGWVVGVNINNPATVGAWATTAIGGGIWGHGGVASDGTNMFVVTGNTINTGGNWMGGEAIIRLQAGPTWTGMPTDYWTPTNWFSLDNSDTDLGGVSATVVDVPGATPSELVLALGKDGNAYLLNRNNLGGIASPVAQASVGGINRGTSAVTYHTSQGTYFGFHNDAGSIAARKVTATSPPTIVNAWTISQNGRGSPWVTTTDGTNNVIVWVAGVGGDQRLHGYDGDTGAVIYAGGGSNELMTGTRQWNTGMVARGRIYFGAANKVYAFKLPTGTPTPTPTPTPTAPPTPAVTTNPATNIASFSATLNGSLNPRGSTTTVYFQYGLTTSYGSNTAIQTQTGNTIRAISASISGLGANTTYHFRIVAHNAAGIAYGSDRTFTTLSATGSPVVITNPATLIASFSATLNGSVDPHGLTTNVYFQYGTTTSYGSTSGAQTQTGSTYRSVSANISALNASTTYHFRIVATNSAGTSYGSDRTLTTLSATGPPVVTTNSATFIAGFSARLNGSVDPHGLITTVYLQYGTTTGYGLTTSPQSKTGNTYQNVIAGISGLTASTTYHFRIVATNSAGTVYGTDQTFTTLSATGPPVVVANGATNVTSSSATLNATVDPHGLTTSVHFQFGTTTSYGSTTPSQSKIGNTYQTASANISGLTASTTYHFRLVATNGAGTTYGSDRTFTTPP